jgi:hypothetical protein
MCFRKENLSFIFCTQGCSQLLCTMMGQNIPLEATEGKDAGPLVKITVELATDQLVDTDIDANI